MLRLISRDQVRFKEREPLYASVICQSKLSRGVSVTDHRPGKVFEGEFDLE